MAKPEVRVVDPKDREEQDRLKETYGPFLGYRESGRCDLTLDLSVSHWSFGKCCRPRRHAGPHIVRLGETRSPENGYQPGDVVAYRVADISDHLVDAA